MTQKDHEFRGGWPDYKRRDRILAVLGFDSYADYVASDRWARIRKKVFKKRGSKCCKCINVATQVHHSAYDMKAMTGKRIKHLWPVCGPCHAKAEFDARGKKRTLWEANKYLGTMTDYQVWWEKYGRRRRRNMRLGRRIEPGKHTRSARGIANPEKLAQVSA